MIQKLANPLKQSPFMPVPVLMLMSMPMPLVLMPMPLMPMLMLLGLMPMLMLIPMPAPVLLVLMPVLMLRVLVLVPVPMPMLMLLVLVHKPMLDHKLMLLVIMLLFSFNMVVLPVAPLPHLSICHVIIERKPLTPMVKPGPTSRNRPNIATFHLMITKFETTILLTGYNHIITVETRLHHIAPVTASVTMAYRE